MYYLGRPNIITRIFIVKREGDHSQETEDIRVEAEAREERSCYTTGLECAGRCQPRNVVTFRDTSL